jgi:DNA (cytosine-5)-methyltransferase 1
LHTLRTMHLFAGAGGGILGDLLLGHHPVCAVEIEPYCQQVLSARQKDGCLPWFPIFADVQTFDGRPWRGFVDVVSGGFPCQDISTAGGANRKGLDGNKSGLWSEMHRIIDEVRPKYTLIENSPAITFRGLDRVLADLASIRFDARWGVFSAADVGARHRRERIWIAGINRDANQEHPLPKRGVYDGTHAEPLRVLQSEWWSAEDRMAGTSDGVAHWVDRFGAIGNGQVPAVVVLAWRSLIG